MPCPSDPSPASGCNESGPNCGNPEWSTHCGGGSPNCANCQRGDFDPPPQGGGSFAEVGQKFSEQPAVFSPRLALTQLDAACARAGLAVGDEVFNVDGHCLGDIRDALAVMFDHRTDRVTLGIYRPSTEEMFSVTITRQKESKI